MQILYSLNMKIFIVSDIHGSADDLSVVMNEFDKQKADLLLLIGDYLNHGPRNNLPLGYDTKKTAQILNQYSEKIIGVRGNCDSEVDQMMLTFPCLADFTQLVIPTQNLQSKLNGRIFLHHGHLYTKDYLQTILPKGSLIISGHTHYSSIEKTNGYIFLNPGSISIPKNKDGKLIDEKTFSIIETNQDGIKEIKILTLDGSTTEQFSNVISNGNE